MNHLMAVFMDFSTTNVGTMFSTIKITLGESKSPEHRSLDTHLVTHIVLFSVQITICSHLCKAISHVWW